MTLRTPVNVLDLLDRFWDRVKYTERDILENGPRGRLPPDWAGDLWDDGFAAAYAAIKHFLRRYKERRVFSVPIGLRFRSRPIVAETGHEGLMLVLNPGAELYGELGFLDSLEYRTIKEAACGESHRLSEELAKRVRRGGNGKPPRSQKSSQRDDGGFSDEATVVLAFLMRFHGCDSDEPHFAAVKDQDYIAEQLGGPEAKWNQTRVSRAMDELMADIKAFGHLGPMARYRRLCLSEQICRELLGLELRRFRKGFGREFGSDGLDDFPDPNGPSPPPRRR
jgi:hypothetical protein